MLNFSFYNPTRILFGRDSVQGMSEFLPSSDSKIMLVYGGGSIKKNGIYEQVLAQISSRKFVEFGGIEPNPDYETLMRGVELARKEKVDFLLAVGGGSVVDGTKFMAAAIPFEGENPWDILLGSPVHHAVPIGCVLTLPATGSESNAGSVISYRAKGEKRFFGSPLCYPRFAVLDPAYTFSLDKRQTINGIVDAFVHVLEQYLTYPVDSPLQDRFAEGIIQTLVEEGPKVIQDPNNYDARANIMWCCTLALNGLIGCGVPQDWATHMIGHELTAEFGLDHAQTLAIVLPGVLRHQLKSKADKLAQYSKRVWNLSDPLAAIEATEMFFRKLGMRTRLSEYDIDGGLEVIRDRLQASGRVLGEHGDLDPDDALKLLCTRI